MQKRIIQIFAVIFAVGILASCLIVPAAAADQVNYVEHYDGMMKDAMYFGKTAPEGYSVYSNLDQFYTVKKGENAIAFENNGTQGDFAHWRTPFLNADGCILLAQEYAVFDNNIPQITYQFYPKDGEKFQVARFTTDGRLFYFPYRTASHHSAETEIVTFQPSEDVQICAFRDELLFDPYTETLTIRRWYWANGNYDEPVYKFEVVTHNYLYFKRSSGDYGPEDFQILGIIRYADDYFLNNVVQIQMTRHVVRTWRLALTRDEFLQYNEDKRLMHDLEIEASFFTERIEDLEYALSETKDELYEANRNWSRLELENNGLRWAIEDYKDDIEERDVTIKDLREGAENHNALRVLIDGIFDGVNGFLEPIYNFGVGGMTIKGVLGTMGILVIIVVVIKLVRG